MDKQNLDFNQMNTADNGIYDFFDDTVNDQTDYTRREYERLFKKADKYIRKYVDRERPTKKRYGENMYTLDEMVTYIKCLKGMEDNIDKNAMIKEKYGGIYKGIIIARERFSNYIETYFNNR